MSIKSLFEADLKDGSIVLGKHLSIIICVLNYYIDYRRIWDQLTQVFVFTSKFIPLCVAL
jgi:hypothetical protein